MNGIALKRDHQGGYTAVDGRFTLAPVFPDPPGGTGVKTWLLTDTKPGETYSALMVGGKRHCHTLYQARETIESVLRRPVSV